MSEQDLLHSVELARHQLTALRARLETEGAERDPPEIRTVLSDLEGMLGDLHAHGALMRELLARTTDAVFAKDPDGRYVMINEAGALMFGRAVAEIQGRDDTALFASESAERIMSIDREVMSTGRSHSAEADFDIGGVPITLLTTATAWYEPRGTLCGLIGSARDVTDRREEERAAKDRHDRLRTLTTETVITEERARQSLAAQLHNGLGQDIALAKMKLSALRSSSDSKLHAPLVQIESLIEQADRSLRSITFQLSPPSLHDLGLVPALQWLAEDIGGKHDLSVRIEDAGTPALADDRMRMILFRAVRELLMNAAVHARASRALVTLGSEDGRLRIRVKDDGVGFEPVEIGLRGFGLFGIREQLRYVGGDMHIHSRPGQGTTVTLTVAPAAASAGTA